MAKVSSIEKNKRRREQVAKDAKKRARLKMVVMSRELEPEERFMAQLKLAEMPRDGSKTRVRNRCRLTGRPRGYYRKFGLSRIGLRDMAQFGCAPGVVKSSW
jgi:small subunit ribosomal protein S14